MRKPAPYETDYRHERRQHRHKCRCCMQIINAGEPVLMAKVANRTTYALHEECADKPVMSSHPNHTWRDQLTAWSK